MGLAELFEFKSKDERELEEEEVRRSIVEEIVEELKLLCKGVGGKFKRMENRSEINLVCHLKEPEEIYLKAINDYKGEKYISLSPWEGLSVGFSLPSSFRLRIDFEGKGGVEMYEHEAEWTAARTVSTAISNVRKISVHIWKDWNSVSLILD